MKTLIKYFSFLLASLLVLLAVFLLTFHPNHYRSIIKERVMKTTGVKIETIDFDFSIFTPSQLGVNSLSLSFRGQPILQLDQVMVGYELLPLFDKKIILKQILIKSLNVDQVLLPPPTSTEARPGKVTEPLFSQIQIRNILAQRISLAHEDKKVALQQWNLKNLTFDLRKTFLKIKSSEVKGLSVNIQDKELILKKIDVHGENLVVDLNKKQPVQELRLQTGIQSVQYQDKTIEDIRVSTVVQNAGQEVNISNFSSPSFGEKMVLSSRIEIADIEKPTVSFELKELNLENLQSFLKNNDVRVKGNLNAKGKLTTDLTSPDSLSPARGEIFVDGEKFNITGMDMDQLVQSLLDTLQTDWIDVVGIATMGPLGLLASSAFQAGKSVPGLNKDKSSEITELHSTLKLQEGMVSLEDVAFRTPKNRVAVRGQLDLKQKSFKDVEAAILDKKGCSQYTQQVTGTFEKPDLHLFKTATTGLTSPVTDVLSKAAKLVSKCEVFYKGSVKHP